MRRMHYKYLFLISLTVYVYYFFGIGEYMQENSFDNFEYPLAVDIVPYVQEIVEGRPPSRSTINYYNYNFQPNISEGDKEKLNLIIAVKSSMGNFGHRAAIRHTYGQFKASGKKIRTFFFLGIDCENPISETQLKVDLEMQFHNDIIQMGFLDTYENSTVKVMMTFRWLREHCPNSEFYFFTDDDMYVSVSNILRYIDKYVQKTTKLRGKETVNETGSSHLFAGYVFESRPIRCKGSKWYMPIEEYPWDRWPRYITGGAFILSNKSMMLLYLGSLFVKHFRFEDIYLSIVAGKLGIVPIHCKDIHFYKKRYSVVGYSNVIASHGYGDHAELIRVWNEQNDEFNVDDEEFDEKSVE